MSKELLNALNALEVEKGVKKEIVIEALEAALVSAYKRNYGQAQNVEVEFDKITCLAVCAAIRPKSFGVTSSRIVSPIS